MRPNLESLAHREAKRHLLLWLRESAAKIGSDNYADFCGIAWRVNRGPKFWGVWSEYPILRDGFGITAVWDEWNNDEIRDENTCIPSYRDLIRRGTPPAVILDIAIQHKGMISYAIEIKHKHACSQQKIDFLRNQDITLLEIPAHWILGQVARPASIPDEFYLLGNPPRRDQGLRPPLTLSLFRHDEPRPPLTLSLFRPGESR